MTSSKMLLLPGLLTLLAILQGTSASNCFNASIGRGSILSDDISNFSYELLRQVEHLRGQASQNLLFSPFSVWSALTLASFGAGGETLRQLQEVLGLPGKYFAEKEWIELNFQMVEVPNIVSDGLTVVETFNRIYFDESVPLDSCLESSFLDIERIDTANIIRAKEAVALINGEVSKVTRGMITNLLNVRQVLNSRLILLNALYFNGTWAETFDAKLSKVDYFTKADRSSTITQFMQQEFFHKHANVPELGASLLELPYSGDYMVMTLILPFENETTTDVLNRLTGLKMASARQLMTQKRVNVKMPKFKIEDRLTNELIQALTSMGIRDLFSPSRADLSSFSTQDPTLFINEAIHRTVIEVNERGTAAAAATAIIDTRLGGRPQVTNFHCNRPFIYMISDVFSNIPQFIGTFTDPDATVP